MQIQKWFQQHKNHIALVSGLLIAGAYGGHWFGLPNGFMNSLLVMASIIGAIPIMLQAYQALKVKVISIDLLVSIGVIGAFIIGEYHESAIVTWLFLFGGFLEQQTLKKTRESIRSLAAMAPQTAVKIVGPDQFKTVAVDEIAVGDQVLVRAGAQVPVDGQVVAGTGYVNEASITGEAQLITKSIGAAVYSGSLVDNGTMTVVANQVGDDTAFAKIIELVEDAQDSQSTAERFIDRFATYYTPAVLVLAILIGLVTRDFKLAITILVLGCPGALVIGAPVSIVAGIGNGAKNGVLIKGGEVVNTMAGVDTVIFDKTGTLTQGKMTVAQVTSFTADKNAALAIAAAVERQSDHPLAQAIVTYVAQQSLAATPKITDSQTVKGLGIQAVIGQQTVRIGRAKLLTQAGIVLTQDQMRAIDGAQKAGQSIVLVAIDQQLALLIGVADTLKPDAAEMVTALQQNGVKRLMLLTGDHDQTARNIAQAVGITEYHANLLPAEKVTFVKKAQAQGQTVAFVGDGINDSPSLATADIGIAMGAGTDVAIETSDIVLMQSTLTELVKAKQLARRTARNLRQNIVIAIGTVALLLVGLILGKVQMASGMLVHELSILVVILNAMRLIK